MSCLLGLIISILIFIAVFFKGLTIFQTILLVILLYAAQDIHKLTNIDIEIIEDKREN